MKTLPHIIILTFVSTLFTGNVIADPIYWTDWTGTDQDPTAGFEGHGTITTTASSVDVT